jgi:hypothetical protein
MRATRERARSGSAARQVLVRLRRKIAADDEVPRRAPEHDEVEQRVRAQAVGAVHRHARALADREEPFDGRVGVAVPGRHHLAVDVRRDAAHHVVDRRHDGDRLLDRVHVRELDRDLADRRQALVDHLGAEMVELQEHVVLVRPAAPALLDLLVHRPRDDVARREVLEVRRVALHEALAVAVEEDPAFAADALGDQHAGAGDPGRMELPELHVLERHAPRAPPCRARRPC